MIVCYDGLPGSGKSYAMHEAAFLLAEQNRKDGIITNQPIDAEKLYLWALSKKYRHLARIALNDKIIIERSLNNLLSYKNSVVIFDEAGIFANSRDWAELKKDNPAFIIDLVQVRKDGVDLIWAAQSHEMVDKQLRMMTNFYYRCNSMLGKFYRRYKFDPKSFVKWELTGKTAKHAIGVQAGRFDPAIFGIYNSYGRLDSLQDRGRSISEIVAARQGQVVTSASMVKYDLFTQQYYIPDPETGEPPENLYPRGMLAVP